MHAFKVTNLYHSYLAGEVSVPVLKDINFKIEHGEFVAIQGQSGSGKSTLLYILGLILKPNKGHIQILEKNLSELNSDELAHTRNMNIGFVFQQFHLLPKMSIIDNILLPIMYTNEQVLKEQFLFKAQEYAKYVGLGERLNHVPNQLSGGQQQRVAICRALINDPEIILADEPTGNLDSESSIQILNLLKNLNHEMKKTIIIITHDDEVAKQCSRIIRIKDGQIISDIKKLEQESNITEDKNNLTNNKTKEIYKTKTNIIKIVKKCFPTAINNLKRNITRTALTMVGISVGIAAIFSMLTLGQFTKDKILSGYAELGVNSMIFSGYKNWSQKAVDIAPVTFQFFDWDKDLLTLRKIFPEIKKMSPVLKGWDAQANFGGRSLDQDVRIMGVSDDALSMSRRKLLIGRNFSKIEIEQKSGVCIIGFDIAKELLSDYLPIGQVLRVSSGDNSFGCRIVGVLESTTSNKEYQKPNMQIYLPFTYFQATSGDWWSAQIHDVMIQIDVNKDIEKIGKGIKAFFKQRYGHSGKFRVDSDSILISQMRRFLILFTILLSSIAFVTLAVGGVGITNMMLVSITERYREIGLRKALGATQTEIRIQFLVESMIVCAIAGFIGLLLGFISYAVALWLASKFINKLHFEFFINWLALFISICSIIIVGILSGIFPAMKAEKLEVIDSLRSE